MADKQITPFQLTDQFTMDNFNQRINETNIALQSKPNPNLLDNWYFGNPVDQRDGYVVPPGVTVYAEDTLSTVVGTTTAYISVTKKTSSAYGYTAADGNIHYMSASDVVRGYTGAGYGIDRWKSDFGNPVLIESDEYLTVGSHQFHQLIENYKSFVGKTVTCSVLSIDASVDMYIQTGLGQEITQQRLLDSVGKYVSITTFVMPENATKLDFLIGDATTKKIVACKLELGAVQTLAHRENGVWVLNEIPDYGEQLARCQRYFRRIKAKQVYSSAYSFAFPIVDVGGATWANINVILSTMMRDAKPSVSFHGLSVADYISNKSRVSIADNAARNVIYYTGDTIKLSIDTGITLTDTDAIMMASDGYIDIINDL